MITDAFMENMEVVVKGTHEALGGDAQLTRNVFHYRRTNFAVPFSATAFLTALKTKINGSWLAAVSEKWNYDKISVRCINSPDIAEVESVVDDPGEVTGDSMPADVSFLLDKKTALRGRRYRGRMYIGGVAKSSTLGNAPTAGAITLLGTLCTKLLETVTDAGGVTFVPCLFTRVGSDITVDNGVIFFNQLVSLEVDDVLCHQDSRMSKHN